MSTRLLVTPRLVMASRPNHRRIAGSLSCASEELSSTGLGAAHSWNEADGAAQEFLHEGPQGEWFQDSWTSTNRRSRQVFKPGSPAGLKGSHKMDPFVPKAACRCQLRLGWLSTQCVVRPDRLRTLLPDLPLAEVPMALGRATERLPGSRPQHEDHDGSSISSMQ